MTEDRKLCVFCGGPMPARVGSVWEQGGPIPRNFCRPHCRVDYYNGRRTTEMNRRRYKARTPEQNARYNENRRKAYQKHKAKSRLDITPSL